MSGLIASHLRPGHPDFLDLPWNRPIDTWAEVSPRVEDLPRGESRHPVVFVAYDERLYAVKGMAPGQAAREFGLLRAMEERNLPVVRAVGHCDIETSEGPSSALVTRYLDHSLPYHAVFVASGLTRYRDPLLDALANLLVQLHLAGVYWGDCSLYNTLFLRDAGTLQAVLVDAETAEIHPSLTQRLRSADLDLMEENVAGGLMDLVAHGMLPAAHPAAEIAAEVRRRYVSLWAEIERVVTIDARDRWRISERVRALNALGFSVGEILITRDAGGLGAELGNERLAVRFAVTDRSHHRRLLHALTGLETQEQQARQLVNEIHELRATMSQSRGRSTSLSSAAWRWLEERYRPVVKRLAVMRGGADVDDAELYCRLLEHKWLMSERAQRDVGHEQAVDDLLMGALRDKREPEA